MSPNPDYEPTLRGTPMVGPNFVAARPTVVEIFHRRPHVDLIGNKGGDGFILWGA